MEKKIKIGIVGAGNISKSHIKAYSSVSEVEVVAICDINEDKLNKTADKYDINNRYTSIEAMIEAEELDAVSVCVWNSSHASCTIKALNAGLHVLCEKPMAYSAKEAEQMKECAEKNGKLLMIGFVSRFSNQARIVKDYIDNGYLGDIYYSKAQYIRRHGNPGGWFGNKEISGGGPIIDLGVHVIDRARYFMGSNKPVSVYAAAFEKIGSQRDLKTEVDWRPEDATDNDVCNVEDFATAIIRFDNGSVIQLETSYDIHMTADNGLTLCGDKGGIKTGGEELVLYTNINGFMSDVKIDTRNFKQSKDSFVNEIQHFADCILGKCECNATAEDGVVVMKILDAIYESARTGHEVIIK